MGNKIKKKKKRESKQQDTNKENQKMKQKTHRKQKTRNEETTKKRTLTYLKAFLLGFRVYGLIFESNLAVLPAGVSFSLP